MIQENTSDIKHYFINALDKEDFVMDRSGQKTIELIGASFFADQPVIFGTPNESYIEIEKAWYESQSTTHKSTDYRNCKNTKTFCTNC